MGSLYAYSGLSAKLRAMQGRLLDESDYLELAGMASVSDIVSFLKGCRAYGEDLAEFDASNVRRETLERVLNFSKYRDFTGIYRFANATQRKYLDLYVIRYETALFKWILRNLSHDYDKAYAAKLGAFFSNYSSIDVEELLKAKTVEEVTEVLAGIPSAAPYYKLFKKIESEGKGRFDYMMALDMYFFRYAWNKKERLFKKSELKNITRLIGTETDMLNIIWIYRAGEYYKLTYEEICSLIIPVYHRLRREQVRSMAEASDRAEFAEALKKTVYGSRLDFIGDRSVRLEKEYNHILGRLYDKFYRNDPYSPAAINNYLYKKEMEIKKIITISECVRYKYPADEIAARIL